MRPEIFSYVVWGIIIVIFAYKFIRAIRIVPQRMEYIVDGSVNIIKH